MMKIIQSLNRRERLMLFAFIVVCLLIWASSLARRWESSGEILAEARSAVEQQAIWLQSEPLFQAQLEETLARLDAERMRDGNELTAFIDSYAREHDLKHELSAPRVTRGKVSSRATVTVTLRNASLEALIALQLALDAERPYIAVEGLALSANRADPRLFNARLTLTSLVVSASPTP